MHHSEWLNDAKRVPVGQNRRVYHGAERRPNLVVWNNEDSWSCYCHSCHTGGKVYKELLQKAVVSAPVYRKYLNVSDCVTLDELASKHSHKFKVVVMLLHAKRMSTALLRRFQPLYNLVDDRLVFRYKGVQLGRDCTGRSHAKWLMYHMDDPLEYVYLQGRNSYKTHEPVVLTEDLFSAIKINHYTGYSAMCCLGTRIHDSIIQFLVATPYITGLRSDKQGTVQYHPVLAFDGDDAGDRAKRSASQRLGVRGITFSSVRVPDGLDPKDLNHNELVDLFKFLGDI